MDALIDGSVSVSAGMVRARVNLVDVASERSMWSESYEREVGDVAVQNQIAEELARRLHPRLTPSEEGGVSGLRVLPAAYEAYLKGHFFWNQRTEGSLAKSLDYFSVQ